MPRKRALDDNRQVPEPKVARRDKDDQNRFRTIRQGSATNNLTKIKKNGSNCTTSADRITQEVTISKGNFSAILKNDDTAKGLRATTYQLLDILVLKLTAASARSSKVDIKLADIMDLRGLKDRKAARKQVTEDLETLFNTRISYRETTNRKGGGDFADIRLISAKSLINGKVSVTFSQGIYEILSSYPVMDYPAKLLEINSKLNPNSYFFFRKIAELKKMNGGKKNEDIITVRTLLEASPEIPTYEKVMATDRMYQRRIIDPFERDLDALWPEITWEYCHSNGTPLEDSELEGFNYDIFEGLLIKVCWAAYPDQTERLERKAERQELAKLKQARRRPRTYKRKTPEPSQEQEDQG